MDEPRPLGHDELGVLLVDDDENVRRVIALILERAGYRVETAKDGFEAIDLFSKRPRAFDAIVLDASMPGLGGIETLGRLRAIRQDVPVLISSGLSRPDEIEGDDRVDFIAKPYRYGDLDAKLRELLRR